jgi:hypothetical protein
MTLTFCKNAHDYPNSSGQNTISKKSAESYIADFGFRIADLTARCWILTPVSSEFGGSIFSHHKGTKAPRLNKQKTSHHSSNLLS